MNTVDLGSIALIYDIGELHDSIFGEVFTLAYEVMREIFTNAGNEEDVHLFISQNGIPPGHDITHELSLQMDQIEAIIKDASAGAVFNAALRFASKEGIDEDFTTMCAHKLLEYWGIDQPPQETGYPEGPTGATGPIGDPGTIEPREPTEPTEPPDITF